MASAKYDYGKILEIAQMSLEEYKEEFGGKSDEAIQATLDAMKQAADIKVDWDKVTKTAASSYEDMYDDSLKYLQTTANVTDAQWDSAYKASVSDNYADGTKLDGNVLANVTVDAGDGTKVDWSETQIMKKTKLSDGAFRTTDASGKNLDDFSGSKIGTTRAVAGGTITNLGVAEYGLAESVDVDDKGLLHSKDYVPLNDTQKGTMVHYEGYLGSFDYNTRDFEIAYYETEVDGNKISVPTLHYIGDGGVSLYLGGGQAGITDGSKIVIPKGIINADYMFAGNQNITSMPKLPDSLESAHGMFLNCTGMTEACSGALDEKGTIKMPSKLKDISWMFSGCTQLKQAFGDMGSEMLDARYAFSDCKKLGYLNENGKDGEMNNSFTVPDMTHLRYANKTYLENIFDNSNAGVDAILTQYVADNPEFGSSYTTADGVHNNDYDKLVDGSFDKEKELMIAEESSRQAILKMTDKNAKGVSGVAADTDGTASTSVKLTDAGTFADDSTWAKFMQDDFSGSYTEENKFGEILDRAIPAVGTYAISKSLLNRITGGRFKSITTLGSVALAAVPQVVGFGNKLTPMLDWTANAVGPDSKVGKFLSNLSDKLKGKTVNYATTVEELNADSTFEEMQDSATNYAAVQLSNPFKTMDAKIDGDTSESVVTATRFDVTAEMAANGKKIANDANLLFIACEPEENIKNTMSGGVMQTMIETVRTKMEEDVKAANGDSEKLKAIAEKYSTYYQTALYNLDAYNDAAVEEVGNQYMQNPELKAQATNGLEKVMRTTATPLYAEMKKLQTEWKSEYEIDFFSDKQLNDTSDKLSIQNANIAGLGTFNDFDPNKDYSDQSDTYVEKLQTYQTALTNAINESTSPEEINAAYASYYETAYGWALDEAEAHGVVLDKRGAQTTSEKNSFSEQLALLEAAKTEKLTSGSVTATESQGVSPTETPAHESNTAVSTDTALSDTTSAETKQSDVTAKRVAQAAAAGIEMDSSEANNTLTLS